MSHLNTVHLIALTCVSAKKQDTVRKLDARVRESIGWAAAVVHLQSSVDPVIMPSPNFCQHALAVRCVLFHDLEESDAWNT